MRHEYRRLPFLAWHPGCLVGDRCNSSLVGIVNSDRHNMTTEAFLAFCEQIQAEQLRWWRARSELQQEYQKDKDDERGGDWTR